MRRAAAMAGSRRAGVPPLPGGSGISPGNPPGVRDARPAAPEPRRARTSCRPVPDRAAAVARAPPGGSRSTRRVRVAARAHHGPARHGVLPGVADPHPRGAWAGDPGAHQSGVDRGRVRGRHRPGRRRQRFVRPRHVPDGDRLRGAAPSGTVDRRHPGGGRERNRLPGPARRAADHDRQTNPDERAWAAGPRNAGGWLPAGSCDPARTPR